VTQIILVMLHLVEFPEIVKEVHFSKH